MYLKKLFKVGQVEEVEEKRNHQSLEIVRCSGH